jgi:hypothetical protein
MYSLPHTPCQTDSLNSPGDVKNTQLDVTDVVTPDSTTEKLQSNKNIK